MVFLSQNTLKSIRQQLHQLEHSLSVLRENNYTEKSVTGLLVEINKSILSFKELVSCEMKYLGNHATADRGVKGERSGKILAWLLRHRPTSTAAND